MTRRAAAFAAAALLAGCAVGPNFHAPAAPTSTRYEPEQGPSATVSAPGAGGGAQSFAWGQSPPERWWTLFGSDELDRLVDAVLAANPDLAKARLSLKQAQIQLAIARGGLLPTVDVGYQAERSRASANLSPPLNTDQLLYTLHTAQVTVAYQPDVFGGVRRGIENSKAQAEAARQQLRAARETLIANMVLAYVQIAALREQIAVTQRQIETGRSLLVFLDRRRALGDAGEADVLQERSVVAQAQATLPGLGKALDEQRTVLALLLNVEPSAAPEVSARLDGLVLPPEIPVTLPSALVRRRPDILAAADALHAASAQVGVALAARLPAVTLGAVRGGVATDLGDILSNPAHFWSLTAGVTAPVFHAGALRGQQRIAEAELEKAKLQYRQTVVAAFGEVSDALGAVRRDAETLAASADATTVAERSLTLLKTRETLGDAGQSDVLLAQAASQQAALAVAQARAQRLSDTVAVFNALGASTDTP